MWTAAQRGPHRRRCPVYGGAQKRPEPIGRLEGPRTRRPGYVADGDKSSRSRTNVPATASAWAVVGCSPDRACACASFQMRRGLATPGATARTRHAVLHAGRAERRQSRGGGRGPTSPRDAVSRAALLHSCFLRAPLFPGLFLLENFLSACLVCKSAQRDPASLIAARRRPARRRAIAHVQDARCWQRTQCSVAGSFGAS